jgi:hypothetical protein
MIGLLMVGLAGVHASAATGGNGGAPSDLPALSPDETAMSENMGQEVADLQEIFQMGYENYIKGRYLDACIDLYHYYSNTDQADTENSWAAFFLGISLKKAGFSHAAVDALANLVTKKPNTKVVNYSLELLEEISRNQPFDRELLIETAVCDQSYDFVEGDIADFVNFYQGKYNWERGLFSWGDQHFKKLRKGSFYHSKYLFENGLREYYAGETDTAISLLKQVLQDETASDSLRNDARKTLARILYEVGNFDEADFLYQQIEMNIVEQSQNLLERAWVHYRMGNPERSMGLLYSFEAPSFRHSFTPEFFILKSFIYKDVCHYEKAMGVLEDFSDRYGEALRQVYERNDIRDMEALLLVILNKPGVKRLWKFLSLLEEEQALVEDIQEEALAAYLQQIYRLKREEYERRLRQRITDVYEEMANTLLQYEEEANLMAYEIGLDMYQRVSEIHYSEDKQTEETSSKTGVAVYPFQGEFWNDELDQYTVSLPDKCQDAEEWDIFFK